MSTILDALRKVERERDPSADPLLDAPTVSAPVRRRRNVPLAAILACAVLGFGGGAVLSWLLPSEQATEIAALPEPPAPPDIAVPRPPLRAKAVPPAVPVTDQAGAAPAQGAPPAAPAVASGPAVAAPVAPAPAEVAPPRPPTAVEAPAPVVASKPAEPAAPAVPRAEPDTAVAAVDPKASALEPSPFGPAREATVPVAKDAAVEPGKAPAPARVEPHEPQDVAALQPTSPPVEEPAEEEAVVEPEPEAPAETVIDTGRSPAGAPKVALSFLQWSAEPERRFAFISIDGAPSQRVHEGEVAAGLTVAAITPTGVRFKREGTVFMIRPRH